MVSPRKVLNPHTGRYVSVGGAAYKRMMETTKQNSLERQKSRKEQGAKKSNYPVKETKGWSNRSPRTKGERDAVFEKCGAKCFLIPSERKFPVCEKTTKNCKVDCGGLLSAKIRAHQWGYWPLVSPKVERLYKEASCSKKKK